MRKGLDRVKPFPVNQRELRVLRESVEQLMLYSHPSSEDLDGLVKLHDRLGKYLDDDLTED